MVRQLEGFSAKVIQCLNALDETGVRDINRALVRRIEIDDARIEVVFRVPSLDGSPGLTRQLKQALAGNIVQASVENIFAWFTGVAD